MTRVMMAFLLSTDICMIKERTIGININPPPPRWKALWIEMGAEQTFCSLIDVQQRGAQRSGATLIYKAFIVCAKPSCNAIIFTDGKKNTNLLHKFGSKSSAGRDAGIYSHLRPSHGKAQFAEFKVWLLC